jgi:putative ABC transport system permease protein
LLSLNQLRAVDSGVEAERVLTGSIRLPGAQYQDPARIDAFWDELKRRVAALPGVAGVAYSDGLPPTQPG